MKLLYSSTPPLRSSPYPSCTPSALRARPPARVTVVPPPLFEGTPPTLGGEFKVLDNSYIIAKTIANITIKTPIHMRY